MNKYAIISIVLVFLGLVYYYVEGSNMPKVMTVDGREYRKIGKSRDYTIYDNGSGAMQMMYDSIYEDDEFSYYHPTTNYSLRFLIADKDEIFNLKSALREGKITIDDFVRYVPMYVSSKNDPILHEGVEYQALMKYSGYTIYKSINLFDERQLIYEHDDYWIYSDYAFIANDGEKTYDLKTLLENNTITIENIKDFIQLDIYYILKD